MPNTDKRHRKETMLRRFAYVGSTLATAFERQAASRSESAWRERVTADPVGSRVLEPLGAALIHEVMTAAVQTDDPVLSELHRACAMYERPWPDLEGTPSRKGRPHPLVVLALARLLRKDRPRGDVDRDVTTWALWTYCRIPTKGHRGRPRWVDMGDMELRITPELHGLVTESDALKVPALASSFARGTLHRAVDRTRRLVARAMKLATPPVS
jgi:hypothetical protein